MKYTTKEGMTIHDTNKEVAELLVFLEERELNEGEQYTVLQAAGMFTQSFITSKSVLLNLSKMLAS